MTMRYARLHRALDYALDEAEFKESDHPRAENGQFGNGGGGGATASASEIPKPPKNTLQLKRLHEWAKEGKLKSIEKSIELQNKELSNTSISSDDKVWRTQVKSYAEELRKSLGGGKQTAALAKFTELHSHKVLSMSAASPGEPVTVDSAGKMVKIENGTPLYHTSQTNLTKLKDRPMWFTPFQDEAKSFHKNTKDDFGEAKTFEVSWDGSKIANKEQSADIAKEIWPDDDLAYSMFDESVGEYSVKDVRRFIATMSARGFAGSVLSDYSAIGNRSKDSDTVAIFHPNEHVNMKESKKVFDSANSGRSARLHRALDYVLDSVGYR